MLRPQPDQRIEHRGRGAHLTAKNPRLDCRIRLLPVATRRRHHRLVGELREQSTNPAIVGAQRALVNDVSLATVVGRKLFPPAEAEMIADVVAHDLPYYTPAISDEALVGLIGFTKATGLLKGSPTREQIVATQFSRFFNGATA